MPRSRALWSVARARAEAGRGGVWLGLSLALLLLAGPGAAQGLETRVQVVGDAQDPVRTRIERELGLLAIEVHASAAERAPVTGIDAVVVVESGVVRIRFAPEHGGDTLEVPAAAGERPELVALATAELLRGRLLEVPAVEGRSASAPTAGSAASSRRGSRRRSGAEGSRRRAPGERARSVPGDEAVGQGRSRERFAADGGSAAASAPWGILIGAELFGAPDWVPSGPGLLVGLELRERRGWYVAGGAHLPLNESRTEVSEGAVARSLTAAALTAGHGFTLGVPEFRLQAGAGLGVLRARFTGEPGSPSFTGETTVGFAAWPHLELVPVWQVRRWLALRGALSLGLVLPPVAPGMNFLGPTDSASKDVEAARLSSPGGFFGFGLELCP